MDENQLTSKDYIKHIKNSYNLNNYFSDYKQISKKDKALLEKWKEQRIRRGYSSYDLFDFDTFLLNIFINGLKDFIKHVDGYPQDFSSLDEWCDYLNSIRQDFISALVYSEYVDPNNFQKNYETSLEYIKSAFEKLGKYFFALWG